MTPIGILQIVVFFGLIVLVAKPFGAYMARVFEGERTWLDPVLKPIERLLYKLFGVKEDEDMKWTTYGFAMLMFSVVGGLLTFALLRLQGRLPFNPQHFTGDNMTPDLSFNTAMSFITNTNWQSYTPEQVVSYFSNMVALAAHNWMSAATGIAVAIAVVRGFARHTVNGIGSFWVDVTRSILYVLMPICLVYAIFLVWQGVPQNFHPYVATKGLEGAAQSIPGGAVASQEAIKMLGTNGGGIFNANSAHPYENPTPLCNFVQMLSIFLIPGALCLTFGKMVRSYRQGWAIFAAMSVLFVGGVATCYYFEAKGNPTVTHLGVMAQDTGAQPGGNMEGKETRFGISASTLFTTVTTDASCGAVNNMHDSLTPVAGFVPLFNLYC
ncbi:MAG TPA: potassium-transporting ATPase subunit KdpA, partial [Chthonomonadaceae bacterium]|nr:potassium-transporting ATPase subunit KdpA [Chthonomonadaceae bacterium]